MDRALLENPDLFIDSTIEETNEESHICVDQHPYAKERCETDQARQVQQQFAKPTYDKQFGYSGDRTTRSYENNVTLVEATDSSSTGRLSGW